MMPSIASTAQAIEAIGDPWLEHVVVGRAVCLHQPITRAVALLPDAAERGIDAQLPARANLVAAGFLTPTRPSSSPVSTKPCGTGRRLVEHAVVLGRYRLSGGAIVALACECSWLGPRLKAVLAPNELDQNAVNSHQVAVTISVRRDDTYDLAIDDRVVLGDVPRCSARRFALNIVLVEALRQLTVGAVLHGASVGFNGRAVLLVGRTGAGKSTLALASFGAGSSTFRMTSSPFRLQGGRSMHFRFLQA